MSSPRSRLQYDHLNPSSRRRQLHQLNANGRATDVTRVLGYGSDVSTYGGGVGGYGWLGRGGGYSVSGGAIDFSGSPRTRYLGNRLGASGPTVGWGGTGFDGYRERRQTVNKKSKFSRLANL